MGIIKIRHQGPGKDNYVHQCPVNYEDGYMLTLQDKFPAGEDHDNGTDDSDLSDTGCEYALVNDQVSNIPYELYELTNLNDVLCLETWNLCLTEEERFHLAAYFPDMDQETFEFTMIELLRGDDLYFGSPLETLFRRLKGGFYSRQVSQFREGLKVLQERVYYHSLRSYHESMTQKFVEMRKAWSNSQPNTNVEERVQIWKNKNQRPVFPVDLNAVPLDEELPYKDDKKIMGFLPARKATFINEEVITHAFSTDLNSMTLHSRRKAKGVLKLKPPEVSSAPKQIILTLPSETWEPIRRSPKGVLKVKPKGYPTSLAERARVNAVSHASKPSPSHSASQQQDKNITKNLDCGHQLVGDYSIYGGSLIPGLDCLDTGSKLSGNTRKFSRKLKVAKGIRLSSNVSSGFGECFDSQQKGALLTSSSLYRSAPNNNWGDLMPLCTDASEATSRNLISTTDYEMFPTCTLHSELQSRDKDVEGVEKSYRFPITYKRKKPHIKPSALQNQIKPSAVASIATVPTGTHFNHVERTRAIRIRIEGWNDFNSQHKQGVLDGQHLGPPSM